VIVAGAFPAATATGRAAALSAAPEAATAAPTPSVVSAAPTGTDTVPVASATAVEAAVVAPAVATPVASLGQPTPMPIGSHAPQAPGLGGAFVALVLVLGLILGLAWLLKRLPGSGLRQADGLRVVASIPLGGKERAAVLQVGGEQLLVGIGAGGVRTLHVLPTPLAEAPPLAMPTLKSLPDFRQLLAQRLRKDS